jgi:hypothetical protein
MKSQVRSINRRAGLNPLAVVQFAAMALAAAVVAAAPARSNARESHHEDHAQAYRGSGQAGAAHAARADSHGGGAVGFHARAPGVHGGYAAGWHGGDGRWEHGWHGGHYGWWYVDAGIWAAYPYYPYGYPYGYYPYYAYPPYGYDAPEAGVTYNNLPPQVQTWYYCDASRAYYPSVQSCPAGWRPVTPQAAPPPASAPAAPR